MICYMVILPKMPAVASGFNSMLQCFMWPKWLTCTSGIHMVGWHGVVGLQFIRGRVLLGLERPFGIAGFAL